MAMGSTSTMGMDEATLKMLAGATGEMSKDEIADMLRTQKAQYDKDGEEERQRERDPMQPGRWVTLTGLKTEAMNGQRGEIVQAKNEDGRLGVRISGEDQGDKLIKEENVQPLVEDDVVKVARIGCRGEAVAPRGCGGVRTWHWPRQVLQELPSSVCPLGELIGIPLHVTKVLPHKKLEESRELDNFIGAAFMNNPATGIAPADWQAYVGPVLLWRPNGEPLSADDACLVHGFITGIANKYPDLVVEEDISPEIFQAFKETKLEQERANPMAEKSEDVNI